MTDVKPGKTVWVMTLPRQSGGRYVHAVFASEALASEWLAANPTACADGSAEPFVVIGDSGEPAP